MRLNLIKEVIKEYAMKKIIGFLTLLLFIFTLSACDSEEITPPVEDTPTDTPIDGDTPSEKPDETPGEDETPEEEVPTPDPTPTPTPDPDPIPTPKPTLALTGYYAPLNGTVEKDFKQKLHSLLEKTHTTRGSYSQAWTILEDCDKDPSNPNNILCFYTNQSIPKTDRASSGNGTIHWNREHLWPKSLGFTSSGEEPHNDCHHLHASEEKINGSRGNLDFNEVTNPTKSDSYGNRWNSNFFEPRDEIKGDIARSLLYMAIRYDGDTCNGCKLDLELTIGNGSVITENNLKTGRIGDINALLKWHYEDPVDDIEKNRNNIVASYQGNRNPFIDHEEFVAYLYTSYVGSYTDTSNLQYLI